MLGNRQKDGPQSVCVTQDCNPSSGRQTSITIRNGNRKSGEDCNTIRLRKRPSGLVLRGSIFYNRRRVPHDIRAIVGRSELWKSLRTDSKALAIRRLPSVVAKVERLKNGVFLSLVDLQAAINRFVREYNANDPKPFIWKADPDEFIAARNRGFQTWNQSTSKADCPRISLRATSSSSPGCLR